MMEVAKFTLPQLAFFGAAKVNPIWSQITMSFPAETPSQESSCAI
jgi:hypothetical protein